MCMRPLQFIISLVLVFFCLAAPVSAQQQRVITSGSFDHHVGRYTGVTKWEVDTRWFMQGANGFFTTVTEGDILPADLIQVRNGATIPAFTLTYRAAQSKGNVAPDSGTGFVNIHYGNVNDLSSTAMTFNIPEHTMQTDVWDLPFTMQGNIVMFWVYTPFSPPQSITPISGSGTVHLRYHRQERNLKAYYLQLAHFEFAAPAAVKEGG